MNNAYILIYEHCSSNEEVESGSAAAAMALPSQSDSVSARQDQKMTVPPCIEQEVLNDNLALLSAGRLAERSYMKFILKLLKSMPSKDDLNRRKMRRVTPCSSRGGSNCESSAGSVTSAEKSPDEAHSNRGERTEEMISTVRRIAAIVCEYIFKVILTPSVFLHADGLEWADAIQIIVENTLSCGIALQKLAEHADRSFRCLICQGNEASKEFLSQFLIRVIQSVETEVQPSLYLVEFLRREILQDMSGSGVDGPNSPISKFLAVVLDYLDHRWNVNFDVSRVLDIACLIAEILNRHGDHHTWLNLFESLMWKSCRYAKIVHLQGRGQFIRSLDITNRCMVRLLNSCLQKQEQQEGVEEDGNPLEGLDLNVRRVIEKITAQRHLIKALMRPTILSDPGTILLLTLISWDNEQGSITILEHMQDYFPDMENCDGDSFVATTNAFLDLVCVNDRYHPMKLTYLLFRGTMELTPWKLICGNIQPLHRWRLLYFLMVACEREENVKQELPSSREWEKVLDWMRRESRSIPTSPDETWLDKHQIYQWASQFED